MGLLEKIINEKKEEVEEKKRLNPLVDMKIEPAEPQNFKNAIKKNHLTLIAEIKRASPSMGVILKRFNPQKFAKIYESSDVDAISFVSDKKFFGGKVEMIKEIKKASSLPVLRKDFIIDEYQIYESHFFGADAILLIVRILPFERLKRFVKIAHNLGIATVLEVHTPTEIDKALRTDTEIIGINNRDLDTLTVGIDVSLRLKSLIPNGYTTISESGISSSDDVKRLMDVGFDAILVGTSLLIANDIVKKIKELKGAGV